MRRRALFDHMGWIWVAGALLPLALVGCRPQQAQAPNAPAERVAGEREEQDVATVIQRAGLPQTFAFGGRTWTAHQVNYTEPNRILEAPTGQPAGGAGTTGANQPAGMAANQPAGAEANQPAGAGANQPAGAGAAQEGDFEYVAVPGLMVAGHQIYRRAALDEAVTDSIYLRAGTGAAGGPGDTNAPAAEGNAPAGTAARVAMVEYDVSQTMEDVPLSSILAEAQMPPTVTWGGRTWRAREMQVYDPDVWDELRLLPQKVNGFTAFQGDDRDELILMSNTSVPMPTREGAAGTPGAAPQANAPEANAPATNAPATNAPAGTTGAPGAETAALSGPVFIRYEATGGGAGAAGGANRPR